MLDLSNVQHHPALTEIGGFSPKVRWDKTALIGARDVDRGERSLLREAGIRVFTMRDPFTDGLYADAGAMQVYDSHQRVQRYIAQFSLDLDPIRPTAPGSLMFVMGHRIEVRPGAPPAWPFTLHADEQSLTSGGMFAKYVVPLLKDVHDADMAGQLLGASSSTTP